jgi:hypothetical protein
MADVAQHWARADGPTAAELFDPVAFQARLVEARARRAQALAARAAPTAAAPRTSERPARRALVLPVFLAGLVAGAAVSVLAVAPLLPHPAPALNQAVPGLQLPAAGAPPVLPVSERPASPAALAALAPPAAAADPGMPTAYPAPDVSMARAALALSRPFVVAATVASLVRSTVAAPDPEPIRARSVRAAVVPLSSGWRPPVVAPRRTIETPGPARPPGGIVETPAKPARPPGQVVETPAKPARPPGGIVETPAKPAKPPSGVVETPAKPPNRVDPTPRPAKPPQGTAERPDEPRGATGNRGSRRTDDRAERGRSGLGGVLDRALGGLSLGRSARDESPGRSPGGFSWGSSARDGSPGRSLGGLSWGRSGRDESAGSRRDSWGGSARGGARGQSGRDAKGNAGRGGGHGKGGGNGGGKGGKGGRGR